MKKIKKLINGLIAFGVAQLPLLFLNETIMLIVFIIGLLTILVITYLIMMSINY